MTYGNEMPMTNKQINTVTSKRRQGGRFPMRTIPKKFADQL